MRAVGSGGQRSPCNLYDASGTISSGGTAQLVLPRAMERTSLILENISDTDMLFEFGAARATASLSSGAVSSVSVANAGFGYSKPPLIIFYGGSYLNINQSSPTFSIAGLPDYPTPSNPAQAHCVMSGSAPNQTVGSIVVDNPGSSYEYPPFVFLMNDPSDMFGCAVPSASVGVLLKANGGSYTNNSSICITDQISVFCASSSKAFTCKYTI